MRSMREQLLSLLYEFTRKKLPDVLPRDINVETLFRLPHVIDILGARRSGKTYLIYNMIKYLLSRGVDRRRILYVDFEHKDLEGITSEDLDAFLSYLSHEDLWDEAYFFLDEIHNVKGWERWVRTIYDEYKGKIKVVISGSTSKILKPEISSILTGRHITLEVFPLSFKEFLIFKKIKIEEITRKPVITPREKYLLESLLQEYMEFGGFPEVVLAEGETEKLTILANYYNDFLYRDLVERFQVRNIRALRTLFKFLISNISRYFSYRRAKSFLAGMGLNVSTSTLERWCGFLEEIYLLFLTPIFTKKVTVESRHPRKIYIVDVGLRRVILRQDIDRGQLLENIVFLEIRRRINPVRQEIRYWANKGEVDFIVIDAGEPVVAIQVTESIRDPETRKREIRPLVIFATKNKIEKTLIVTLDQKEKIITKNTKIEVVPFWEFALKEIDEIIPR